jgi:hypothetical protein
MVVLSVLKNKSKNNECMHVKCKFIVIVVWNNSTGIKLRQGEGTSQDMEKFCRLHLFCATNSNA